MSRLRRRLRGSVTQNTSVRMRARETSRFGFLMRLTAVFGSLAIIVGLSLWLWHIGWPQRQTEKLIDASVEATQRANFSVKEIIVEGRKQVSKDNLSTAIGTIAGAPILTFDPDLAKERITKLPWVAGVIVERRLPDTIFVRLTERVPLARWQYEGKTSVIDTEGSKLNEAKLEQFPQLPLVVGADAAGQAKALLDTLKDYPAVADKMTSAVRVSERRWDIHLQPKVVAKLPEKDLEHALDLLADLITEQKILERDITVIDLRDSTKMFLEPAGAPASPKSGDMRL